jgi:hypothetical protein
MVKKILFKKGQVWIETVIYTLIALVMIASVLAYAKPKLEELQDKALIEQSIGILKSFDNLVLSVVQGGIGNKRTLEIGINSGNLLFNGEKDFVMFTLESRKKYSEPGTVISEGNLKIVNLEKGKKNEINIWRNYSGVYNITYSGNDQSKELGKSAQSYELIISNVGVDAEGLQLINIETN